MSDKQAFNGLPPAAVPMANNVPQTYNASKNVDGYPAAGGAPASRNLSKTLRALTFVLLGFVVLGWISWIVFLAGTLERACAILTASIKGTRLIVTHRGSSSPAHSNLVAAD